MALFLDGWRSVLSFSLFLLPIMEQRGTVIDWTSTPLELYQGG